MENELILKCGSFAYHVQPTPVQWPDGVSNPRISGLAWLNGKLYAANRSVPYPVIVFDKAGRFEKGFGASLAFGRTHGIFVEKDGSVLICDDVRHVIYHINGDGSLKDMMGTQDIPCNNGYDGTVPWPHDLYTVQRMGEPFNRPTDIIRAANGRLFVTDGYGNAAVHRFSPEGILEKTWGGPGREAGKLRLPHSLCEDALGRIWVCDRENFRTQVYDHEGNFVHTFERQGMPSDCWCDGTNMYILEMHGYLSVYDMDFRMIGRMGYEHSLLEGSHSLTGDGYGNLFVGFISGAYSLVRLERI